MADLRRMPRTEALSVGRDMTQRVIRTNVRRTGVVTLAIMATLGLAACGSSSTAVNSPFTGSIPVLQHGPTYEVKAANLSGLGPVLVDGEGITLYLFVTDHRGQPSRCYGICAIQWPPDLLPSGVSAPRAGPGINPHLLGVSLRTDGTRQITYNGWPLYFWPPDNAPGKATGQELTNAGGLWLVVNPAGQAVHSR